MSSLKDKRKKTKYLIDPRCYRVADVDLAVAELKQVLSDCHDKGSIDVGFAIEIIDRIFGESESK